MTILRLQVARIRHGILTPAEQPRELTSTDRQILADNHRRRLAEIVSKQCAQALKHVQNHKVGDVRFIGTSGCHAATGHLHRTLHPCDEAFYAVTLGSLGLAVACTAVQ